MNVRILSVHNSVVSGKDYGLPTMGKDPVILR